MNTLREQYPYYVYGQIEKSPVGFQDILRLLVRLMCRLRPESFCAVGSIAPEAVRVALLTDSAVVIEQHAPLMLLIGEDTSGAKDLATACMDRGGSLVIADIVASHAVASHVMDAMTHGMTFSNGRTLIAVARQDLPRQHFELNF